MQPDRVVRVGLVGAGYVCTYHARALRSLPFVEIVGLADPDQERAAKLAAQFGIPRIYPNLQAMAESAPQVVHILTPPGTHADLAIEAMEMGCHVLVEKPMAETTADCDRMMQRARDRGVVLSVNHSARMDPIVLRALEMVRAGAIGTVTGAEFLRSSDYQAYAGGPAVPPQFGRGAYPFQDLGVHGLYLLEAFLGTIRKADIRYRCSRLGDPNLVFDEWRGLVESDGATGSLYISWNARPIRNELIVHGTRGAIHVDCFLQTLALRKTWPAPKPVQCILNAGFNSLSTLWNVTANTIRFATGSLLPSPGIHVSVVKFHEALHAGQAPPVPAEEGRRIIALLEDVSRRADEDKKQYLAETQPAIQPRILVTGASGFLGRAFVRRLREECGQPVRLLVRRPPDGPVPEDVQYCYGDLGNPAVVDRAVEGIDTVYHLGAAMKGGNFEFAAGTTWGTRNVVSACRKHGVRKLVYVSSLSVLDHAGHARGAAVTELSPYEPHPASRGLYTQTKLEAEKAVLEAASDGGLQVVVLRPGQIYGRGAEDVPPSGTIRIAGRWLVVGSGGHYVPLVHVENVVDALLLAGRKDLPGGSIFHLVDPEGIRQRDYCEQVRRSGRDVGVSYVPAWFLTLAGCGVELLGKILKRRVPLTPYRVRSITPLWPCDCTPATTQLGWKPRYSVEEGMAAIFPAKEAQPAERQLERARRAV